MRRLIFIVHIGMVLSLILLDLLVVKIERNRCALEEWSVDENSLERVINDYREENGLERLTPDGCLRDRAELRLSELPDVFDHQRPNGNLSVDEPYCEAIHRGENLAKGMYDSDPNNEVLTGWAESDPHNRIILADWSNKIGAAFENGYAVMQVSD